MGESAIESLRKKGCLMIGAIKKFKRRISKLIEWFPVIWNDCDFDQAYLYIIVHKKLLSMEKFFNSKYTFSSEASQIAEEIKNVREMMGRVINDEHNQKLEISTRDFISVKDGKFNVNTEHPMYIKWKNETEEAERRTDQDLRNSFRIIGEKSQGWWD